MLNSIITFKIFIQYHNINFDDVIFRFQYLLDGKPDWKHVSTIAAHVVLEQILRAKGKDRNQIIKHLLT